MRENNINEQSIDFSSVELNADANKLLYGNRYYGELKIVGAFEQDNNIYIIIDENNEWQIKQIIIDTLVERNNKQINIMENIIINLNNSHYTTKAIDNIKFYLSTYGSLDQTGLNDVYLNLTNSTTNFYATDDNDLFNKLVLLKQSNKDIPLNVLVNNSLEKEKSTQK